MIVAIQGTKTFNDYVVFLRAMGTALSAMQEGDTQFTVYSAGPHNINSMGLEFINVSENGLKSRGIRAKFLKVSEKFIRDNINSVDYLAFFSKPKEPVSSLVSLADAKDIDAGIYRY